MDKVLLADVDSKFYTLNEISAITTVITLLYVAIVKLLLHIIYNDKTLEIKKTMKIIFILVRIIQTLIREKMKHWKNKIQVKSNFKIR